MFHRLPQVLGGLAWQMLYRPVSQARLLIQSGKAQGGAVSASCAAGQEERLLHAQQLAAQYQLPLQGPARLAFQPEVWLRMAQASSPHGRPNRQVCEALFNAIWQHGHDPDDPAVQQLAWQEATALLPGVRDVQAPRIGQELMELERAALLHKVCDVPGCVLLPADAANGAAQTFMGMDSLPLLREAVRARQCFGADDQGEPV